MIKKWWIFYSVFDATDDRTDRDPAGQPAASEPTVSGFKLVLHWKKVSEKVKGFKWPETASSDET